MNQPDEKSKTNKAKVAVVLLTLLAALPCLYVLSIGPVDYLCMSGTIPLGWQDSVAEIYRPVWWLCSKSDTLDTFAHWYANWFADYFPANLPPPPSTPEGTSIQGFESNSADPFGVPLTSK